MGLAADLERYATASALAEVMLRFAPADPHPESYDLFRDALACARAGAAGRASRPLGFRLLWHLVSVLGFAPSLDACVRDGDAAARRRRAAVQHPRGRRAVPGLRRAARRHPAARPRPAPISSALLDPDAALPVLDERHGAAHRRLLARYIRYHLAEGAELPALEFWLRRPWMAA